MHGSGAVAAAPANSAGTFSTQQAPASALHDLTAGLPRTHSQAPIHPASSVPTLQTGTKLSTHYFSVLKESAFQVEGAPLRIGL